MATLLRSSRDNNLGVTKRFERGSFEVPYRSSTLRDPFFTSRVKPFKESSDPVGQRIKDMNISTSFVNDESEYDSSVESPSDTRGPNFMYPGVAVSASLDVPTARSEIADVSSDPRQRVLELIGDMLDAGFLSEADAGRAIKEAMKRDNTYELMLSLLKARKTLKSQSVFLKLWLSCPTRVVAFEDLSPIDTAPVSECRRPLMRSSSLRFLETMPIPSPPLVPMSLQVADASPSPSGSEREATPSLLMSYPRGIKSFQRPRSIPTPSTMSPSPDLILTAMMGRSQSSGSDDCAV